jgi:hypothetical protein
VREYADYGTAKLKGVAKEVEATVETSLQAAGAKVEKVGAQLELFAAESQEVVKGASQVASETKSLLGTVATKVGGAAKVFGEVAGAINLGVDLAKVATAKTSDERVDASISATGDALMMSKNPVALAAGGGIMLGQGLEHSLHVSDVSSAVGVSVYSGLKQAGLNDTASLVLGGVATVAATPFALISTATQKIAGWF